jgi:hypothetical protein
MSESLYSALHSVPSVCAEYDLDARLYVCSRCGGLLDIERREEIDRDSLRELWLSDARL